MPLRAVTRCINELETAQGQVALASGHGPAHAGRSANQRRGGETNAGRVSDCQILETKDKLPHYRACFRIRSLKFQGTYRAHGPADWN
jgi:hypothetical protein